MNQGPPWPVAVVFVAVWIGAGFGFLLFTDQLCDWQIKLLQSRRYRHLFRVMGGIFVVTGVLLAWAFATHALS